MTLEELIYRWFSKYERLTKKLAAFSGNPAIFYQVAPDDRQRGWENKTQYPRIVYAIDRQANQERKSAGTMEISLLCDEAGVAPEEVEPLVRECLKDIIICPDNGLPYCFAWSRSDGFEIPSRESGADTRIIGTEIRFDILEYPCQETTDPDPVVALNRYIKSKLSNAFVIGLDKMGHFKTATVKAPVFYCRLDSVEKAQETNTVAWMDGKIAIHILCPDPSIRLKLMMEIANNLCLDGEVIMLDYSPMTIKRLLVNNKADFLKDGQLFVTVHYGLLRYQSEPHMMDGVEIDFGIGG